MFIDLLFLIATYWKQSKCSRYIPTLEYQSATAEKLTTDVDVKMDESPEFPGGAAR